ncbi:MAG: hypothetical protein ACD_76C00095G0001 [uncultured bacterium]|nr:MAG: hypothetical protein ACD_76C00095G0001 [uncultured bacterium]HBD05545.1 YebC/PmpR family DNA-binding transcriptional regulator [Candidatus Uhrbacteria bacterium]
MSGHSKWHNIQQKKSVSDSKRAQVFTKLANGIVVAAREAGGDPDTNFKLRMAIEKARSANMPKDNIDRAVARGAGTGGGSALETVVYEAFGPGGVSILIEVLTDNRNRSVADVKSCLGKLGVSLASQGSVMWMFEKIGVAHIKGNIKDKDVFELKLIDAGAIEIKYEDDIAIVETCVPDLQKIIASATASGLSADYAEIEYIAKEPVAVSESDSMKLNQIYEALDNLDDVQNVFTSEK